jgi:hypothetical protein
MPDVSTEVAIATQTLGSAASSINFTSIPATYTDLRVVMSGYGDSNYGSPWLRYNSSSTGTLYSQTLIYGQGSSASSSRSTSQNQLLTDAYGSLNPTVPSLITIDIFSYAGSTYKTCLMTNATDRNGSGWVEYQVGLWRSTSAINEVNLMLATGNYPAGFTATLYGIL